MRSFFWAVGIAHPPLDNHVVGDNSVAIAVIVVRDEVNERLVSSSLINPTCQVTAYGEFPSGSIEEHLLGVANY